MKLSNTPRNVFVIALIAILVLLPVYSSVTGNTFMVTLFTRIVILAIAAVSLNLIMGFGGMVSFGHAAYLGIGGYAVGILAKEGVNAGLLQWPLALAISALFALATGALSLRTRGVYFIMITLAFAQMIYYVAIGLDRYGGDDGMTIHKRSQFDFLAILLQAPCAWLGILLQELYAWLGIGAGRDPALACRDAISLSNKTAFYYLCLVLLLATVYLVWRIVNSRFGMVIQGARSNDRRMRTIGFATYRYKLACFVIAGTICGLSGVLLANHTDFISPAIMHWTRSGDLIVMAVLGGMGTVFGPVIGAVVLLILEEALSRVTEYWQLIIGPLFLLVVLFARGGIEGLLVSMRRG
jgi:branched-chain amino acid transport system permease protein